jgi:hypothetical protein
LSTLFHLLIISFCESLTDAPNSLDNFQPWPFRDL